jgi:hypothetical protein
MEVEFYRVKGWERNIWFTDMHPVALCDWAVENGISYQIHDRYGGKTGIVVADKDKVMFELRWAGNIRPWI